MKRDFEKWLGTFRSSISDYGYYVDFPKIYRNTESIKVELNILNSLIGERDIETKFKSLLSRYPDVIKVIPILISVRQSEIEITDKEGHFFNYNFDRMNYSIDQYCVFMREVGLFDLIQNHLVNNLVDYVFGVECGLDSNGRKNRGGHLMEDLVERYIQKSGFVKDKNYFKELTTTEMERSWGLNLSPITDNGEVQKRFDFVVRTRNKIYCIETNFYGSSGSKLNETSRSYKTLTTEFQELPDMEFVWITDGYGWLSTKRNLKETFDVLDNIYNIQDLDNGIFDRLFV